MKLHITVLASSLMLAMPALAKDISLSQAELIAKSVTRTRRATPLRVLSLNGWHSCARHYKAMAQR